MRSSFAISQDNYASSSNHPNPHCSWVSTISFGSLLQDVMTCDDSYFSSASEREQSTSCGQPDTKKNLPDFFFKFFASICVGNSQTNNLLSLI